MVRFIKRHLIATAAVALVLMGAVGVALAQTGNGEETPSAEQQAAADRVCGGPPPCLVINGYADPAADDSDHLVQIDDALATEGKPASACPRAAAAYEAAGVPVDAFLGPCPDPAEAPGPADAKRLQAGPEAGPPSLGGSP